MRPTQILLLAVSSITAKRLRMLLTVGGIALSVGVIVLLTGLGLGIKTIVTEQVMKSDDQNIVTVSSNRVKELKLDTSTLAKISSVSGVASTEQSVALSGRIVYHGITTGTPIYGVSACYMELSKMGIITGDNITLTNQDRDIVVVSTGLLKALGIDKPSDAIDKPVTLTLDIPSTIASKQTTDTRILDSKEFKIGGIVDKGNAPVVYIPSQFLSRNGVDIATEVKVALSSPDKMPAVRGAIEQMGFDTASIKDTIDQVNQLFGLIQTILVIFGIITLVIAVFGTLNTITIELVQQTRQIGFLRILGIRQRDVGTLFILQAVILSTVGALIGITGGTLLGSFINGIVLAIAKANGVVDKLLVFNVPFGTILLLLPAAIALGWIIGLGPAKRAVNVNPLHAIRGSL